MKTNLNDTEIVIKRDHNGFLVLSIGPDSSDVIWVISNELRKALRKEINEHWELNKEFPPDLGRMYKPRLKRGLRLLGKEMGEEEYILSTEFTKFMLDRRKVEGTLAELMTSVKASPIKTTCINGSVSTGKLKRLSIRKEF
jgi:hypothetical protein